MGCTSSQRKPPHTVVVGILTRNSALTVAAGALLLLMPASSASVDVPGSSVSDQHRQAQFTTSYKPFGYQSGPPHDSLAYDNDDSFAGGLYYDPRHHALHITGSTYSMYFDGTHGENPIHSAHLGASDCFVSVLNLPPLDNDRKSDSRYLDANQEAQASLVYTRRFGTSKSETCSSLFPVHQSDIHSKLYAIGHTEPGGTMTSIRSPGSTKSSVYGFIADLDMPRGSWTDKSRITPAFHGGELLQGSIVQYPVAVTARPGGEVFVALMETNDAQQNPFFDDFIDHPDLTAGGGGGIQEVGRGFGVRIQKLAPKSSDELNAEEAEDDGLKETMKVLWNKVFETSDKKDVELSTLLLVPMLKDDGTKSDILLFAGSTKGYGTAFGTDVPTAGDYDGFLTKMDPNNGYLDADYEEAGEFFTKRIASASNEDDMVTGLCIQPGVANLDVVYVVGTTRGKINPDAKTDGARQAFVMQLKLDTLQVKWAKQIGGKKMESTIPGGTHDVLGLGCAVTPDGFNVFVGGVVKDGSAMNAADYTSKGGDDVFVMELQANGGAENFMRQIGTSEDESLARGGGITVDKVGNPIIMGTTRGSLMRWRGHELADDQVTTDGNDAMAIPPADVFVMSLERRSAQHRESVQDLMKVSPIKPSTMSSDEDDSPEATGAMIAAIVICATLVMLMFCLSVLSAMRRRAAVHRRKTEKRREDTKVVLEDYLKEFHDNKVDVDVKRSATRGWHGSFELRKGYQGVRYDTKSMNAALRNQSDSCQEGGSTETNLVNKAGSEII